MSVGGPGLWNDAQYAYGGRHENQTNEYGDGCGTVEDGADEWNRQNTTDWQCQVEEVVDLAGLLMAVEEVAVLLVNCRDKEVDPRHLHNYELARRGLQSADSGQPGMDMGPGLH